MQLSNDQYKSLRYAFGAFLVFIVSVLIGDILSYVLPVLSLSFLASNKSLSLKEGILFIIIIAFSIFFASTIIVLFAGYPLVLFLIILLVVFHIYYSKHPLMNANIKLWLLISILVLPMVGVFSISLAKEIGIGLISIAIQCILCIWIIYFIFPVREEPKLNSTVPAKNIEAISNKQEIQRAFIRTLVMLPVLLLFYLFNLMSSILILIFIAILSMQAGFGQSLKAGKPLIIGNLAGGILAIVGFEFLTVVPNIAFIFLLVLTIGLYMGSKLFSPLKIAPLFGIAFSTFLLIVGSTTGIGNSEAGSKVWVRVIQIMAAVYYVILSYNYIDKWRDQIYKNEA